MENRDEPTRGYAALRWRTSDLMDAVKRLPDKQPLISNMPDAVLLYTNRYAYGIQELEEGGMADSGEQFGEGVDPAQNIFKKQGGVLVLFAPEFQNQMAGKYGSTSEERRAAFQKGLFLVEQARDGALYTFTPLEKKP